MKGMNILKFEYIKTPAPQGSCGTGYSEPDKFHIVCDKNLYENDIWHSDSNETDIWIDIWYLPEDLVKERFVKTIIKKLGYIENIDEAFELYKQALIPTTKCPYFWKNKNV